MKIGLMTMRDRQGIELEVGQKVAYNLSGGIALGEIVSITPSSREVGAWAAGQNTKWFNILIQPYRQWKGVASKRGVSKVTCSTSNHGDLVDKIVVLS